MNNSIYSYVRLGLILFGGKYFCFGIGTVDSYNYIIQKNNIWGVS